MLILGVVVSIFVFMFDFTPPPRLTKWVIDRNLSDVITFLNPFQTPFLRYNTSTLIFFSADSIQLGF